MFNAIVTHEAQGINPFDLLTSDERVEYEAWSDEVNAGIRNPKPVDFGIIAPSDFFQIAQKAFRKLHPFSQPDSLTRRGNVLIARRRLTWGTKNSLTKWATEDWKNTVAETLENQISIQKVTVDCRLNARVYFTFNDEFFPY